MSHRFRVSLVAVSLMASMSPLPAEAEGSVGGYQDGPQSSGATYRICMPGADTWNSDLAIYAHGYVPFNEPVAIPEDQLVLPDTTSIPEVMNGLGFAFATTSYSTNGLAIREGVQDVRDLVDVFRALHGDPRRIYLGGASEGGLVTVLALERFPETFNDGLAACGPVGSFCQQVNNWVITGLSSMSSFQAYSLAASPTSLKRSLIAGTRRMSPPSPLPSPRTPPGRGSS